MAYLWLGRVDNVCRNNINIFWALPTHMVAVFFIRKKSAWVKYYFLVTAILAVLLLIGFPWWAQRMNTAVLPILGIIIFRSFYIFQNRNHAEKNLLFKGEELKYELRGNGLPVMLVHGFTEDRRIWDPLLTGMEEKYKWILPDLPGSGESAYNDSLNQIRDFAEVITLLENENFPELVLIGHSMGGYISLAFAEKYPEKIRALGLFHSSSYADYRRKEEVQGEKHSFYPKTDPSSLWNNPFRDYIQIPLKRKIRKKSVSG